LWKPKTSLANNLNTRFRVIQGHARRWLAADQEKPVEDVPWTQGSLHDLRRTYATELARHVPIHVLCRYLGHANMLTTQRYYLAVDERDDRQTREALGGLYGRGVAKGRFADPGAEIDEQLTSGADPTDSAAAPVAKIGVPDTLRG